MAIENIMPTNPLYLGDYVLDGYGRRGRVVEIDWKCPESEDWIKAQAHVVTDGERKERWVSMICEGGGSVVAPESRYSRIEPFDVNNEWDRYYFSPTNRFQAPQEPPTVTYRCPECDTYSGTFTVTTDSEGDFAVIHSICGREGTVGSFDPESSEYADVYDRSDPDDPWED